MSALPHAQLQVRTGPQAGQVIPVALPEFMIGRSAACNLVIPDKTVSRRHALIYFRAGVYYIRDLGSMTGTLVNRIPIQDSPLKNGDVIRIRGLELGFQVVAVPVHPPAPPPAAQPAFRPAGPQRRAVFTQTNTHMMAALLAAGAVVIALFLVFYLLSSSDSSPGDLGAGATPVWTPHPTAEAGTSPRSPEQERAYNDLQRDSRVPPSLRLAGEHVRFLTARVAVDPNAVGLGGQARAFLNQYAGLYGIQNVDSELTTARVQTDQFGWSDVVLEQHREGIPVYGGQLVVHISPAQEVASVNGVFVPRTDTVNTNPSLTSDQAVGQAQSAFDAPAGWALEPPSLVIFDPIVFAEESGESHLAWRFDFVPGDSGGEEPVEVVVDAHDGSVLRTAGLVLTALDRQVYDLNNGGVNLLTCRSGQGTLVLSDGGMAQQTQTPAPGARQIMEWTGTIYSYWFNNFSRDSYDNQGTTMRAHIAWSESNASWHSWCRATFFNSRYYCDEVVYHEWTHALTRHAVPGGLVYWGQSGALDESFADVFPFFMDTDPYVGEDCPGRSASNPYRDLANPPNQGQPDHMDDYMGPWPARTSPCWDLATAHDHGCVHFNSGIPNKAAYLLVTGGTHHGVTVNGIGRAKAQQIYYRALTAFISRGANFQDARDALVHACMELAEVNAYGITYADCNEVDSAWRAVGVAPDAVWRLPATPYATLPPVPTATPIIEIGGTQVGTGDIQATLLWNTPSDVDLHLIDPNGEEIYFGHMRSASGGWLDVDVIPSCGDTSQHVENVYWPRGGAPPGRYQVRVHLYNIYCDTTPVSVRVVVYVDGQSREYNLQLTADNQFLDVTAFTR